jgi:hypothetical protein
MRCTHATDSDCSVSCGDGVVDPGEKCEPTSKDKPCPSVADCDDGLACTQDAVTGSSGQCSAECAHMPITAAKSGDGCCPMGANAATDSDCKTMCGDGAVTGSETCDGDCPTSCAGGSGCTRQMLVGSAAQCTAACVPMAITNRVGGDGCCPDGANAATDSDCKTMCGDGAVTGSEKCDSSAGVPCPTSCDDGDSCTVDMLTGSADQCTAACSHAPMQPGATCGDGKMCTASGACEAPPGRCGDGVQQGTEACDSGGDTWECDRTCRLRNLYVACSVASDCTASQSCVDGACVSPCGLVDGNVVSCPGGVLPAQALGEVGCWIVQDQRGYCRPRCETDTQCPLRMRCSGAAAGIYGTCFPSR